MLSFLLLVACGFFPSALSQIDKAGWTAKADSWETNAALNSPADAIDYDNLTFWHTQWDPIVTPFPHNLTIDMQSIYNITAIRYTPRQDDSWNGNIGDFSWQLSTDGVDFYANTDFPNGTHWHFTDVKTPHLITYNQSYSARYVRLNAYSEAGNRGPWASAAEIDVFEVGQQLPNTTSGSLPSGNASSDSTTLSASSNPGNKPNEHAGGKDGESHHADVIGGLTAMGSVCAAIGLGITIYKCCRERW